MIIFQLIILLFSAIIHEFSHGAIAEKLGDPTARLSGRLTLNPLKHLDPFGSFILPLSLYFASGGAFVFGWAKPVPYNPYNLKKPKRDAGLIAIAGPASNLLIAFAIGLVYRFGDIFFIPYGFAGVLPLLKIIVIVNVSLAVFNLVPIPPLDGSKVLFSFLSHGARLERLLEQYGMILLLLFIFFGFSLIIPIISFIYNLII